MIDNFDKKYCKLLKQIIKKGINKQNRTGIDTISVFDKRLKFSGLEHGFFPIPTCRKYFFRGAVVELFWILGILQKQNPIERGRVGVSVSSRSKGTEESYIGDIVDYKHRNNIAYLKREGVHYWDKWADENGDLGPVYGSQLCEWPTSNDTINQIQNIIDTLNTNPDDRRLVFSMWNPAELEQMALPPCHWGGEFYSEPTADGTRRLHLRWIQRSVDTPVGLPYDMTMYAILLFMISKLTNHVPGNVIGLLGDTHIYENQLDGVKQMINNVADSNIDNYPKLNYSGPDVVENLYDFKLEWFKIINYNPKETINLPVAV